MCVLCGQAEEWEVSREDQLRLKHHKKETNKRGKPTDDVDRRDKKPRNNKKKTKKRGSKGRGRGGKGRSRLRLLRASSAGEKWESAADGAWDDGEAEPASNTKRKSSKAKKKIKKAGKTEIRRDEVAEDWEGDDEAWELPATQAQGQSCA